MMMHLAALEGLQSQVSLSQGTTSNVGQHARLQLHFVYDTE